MQKIYSIQDEPFKNYKIKNKKWKWNSAYKNNDPPHTYKPACNTGTKKKLMTAMLL